ncbi:PEP-CTERM sorting domain-containing protein [Lusitaniella coriacea LEGE 07157]|uniref:PEP-CTERM sorting domain-containing protein n=1 Tax=Lusitaniella coriacea LEGE 07157 TaxID=945747 RepID=A0A8J7B6F1_9CYAN|nr:XDD3 family exosortase-dependent surface protein [Lusitaniella coriacea]MBE9114319.1 PEP-CTERM sorting domain-containing protein [Lusitaniella coriacea LEGE 07157]
MKTRHINQFVGSVAVGVCLLVATEQRAQAGELYRGWNYSIDSFIDGAGGSNYEIKGFAVTETADSVYVALTGGTPLTGTDSSDAVDGNIGWGDMFFNFSGKDFATAEAEGNLFGVRFAETNDSGLEQVGLFGNVTTKSVAFENNGYPSLKNYYDGGYNKANTMGTDIATADEAYSYLYGDDVAANPTSDNTQTRNAINSGNFLGEINLLDSTQLASRGLDFGNFSAKSSQTFGFELDKSLLAEMLPSGINSFMAHVFLECLNDGVALAGNIDIPSEQQDVPEPAGLLSLGFVGLTFLKFRKGRQG